MRALMLPLLILGLHASAQPVFKPQPAVGTVYTSDETKGIRFEHGLSWSEILDKAKKENKHVFVDVFTTWCGPCKWMSSTIFTQEEVGSFFNENFISVKVQMDSTDEDSDEVQKWREDAHNMGDKYNVRAYPTFLYFNPQGELVHKIVGGSEARKFIEKSSAALDPEKQYYTLLKRMDNGDKSPELLRTVAIAAATAYDPDRGEAAFKEYAASQKNIFSKDNLELLEAYSNTTRDTAFKLIMANTAAYNKMVGKDHAAEQKLSEIIMHTEVNSVMMRTAKPDWVKLTATLKKKYPALADEVTAKAKIWYYHRKKDWPNYTASVNQYMTNYGKWASDYELNDFAWTTFENIADPKALTQALTWSKRSFEKEKKSMFIDTYANLLYKLGRKKEAIEWQAKAISAAEESEKEDLQKTLEKMKKGVKTWE